jgi:LacI family transcriptional regulator
MLVTKRNPTMFDVAAAAGVSVATVSRALNGGKIAPVTQRLVEGAVARLGYRRNTLARGLVTGRTGVIGVLIPDVVGPLYAQMARGVEDVLGPLGMHLMMVTDNRDPAQERAAAELLLERRVDGLIIIGSRLAHAALERLVGGVPVVLIQRESAGEAEGAEDGLRLVGLDNRGGAALATEHLLAHGHRRIVHVAALRRDGEARLRSYCERLEAAGLEPHVIQEDGSEEGGYRAGQGLVQGPGPSAVFCGNDRTALGLYHALKSAGLHVPDDVSVVGFDDLPWTRYLDPPLTTVRQPGRAMGRAAAEGVLAALRGEASPGQLQIPAELVVRASVRTLGAASTGKSLKAPKGGKHSARLS